MSIAGKSPREPAEHVALRALELVREATGRVPGRGVIAVVVAGEETPIEVPAELSDVLVSALEGVAAGHRVHVVEITAELTTAQAADVLNVSRPHLIKLLDRNSIVYRRVGTHRRVDSRSLLEFKSESDTRARAAADELIRLSQEMGFDR